MSESSMRPGVVTIRLTTRLLSLSTVTSRAWTLAMERDRLRIERLLDLAHVGEAHASPVSPTAPS